LITTREAKRNSGMLLNTVLTLNWSGRLGLPRLHDLNFSNRPVRTRMPGGVAGGDPQDRRLCRSADIAAISIWR
jgi:hypothetical protein